MTTRKLLGRLCLQYRHSNGLLRAGNLHSRPTADFLRFQLVLPNNTRSYNSVKNRADMKGLVYAGLNQYELRDCPMPEVESPTDAVVRMSHTSICGTDLHILKGDVPTVEKGRILGHEGVGTITSLGSAVNDFFVGDIVLISCISSCGTCTSCKKGMNSHCTTGGWVLGNVIDGTQAEYVRVPHAANSLYKLPGNLDLGDMVVLSDAFPTGMECGTLNANVQPGSSVAIVGAGPVGLAAMLTAKLYTPRIVVVIDTEDKRLELAQKLGADKVINVQAVDAMEQLDSIVDGKGFDSVFEAVGIPTTFDLCQRLVAPGGVLANIGVHGQKVSLDLDKLWDRNISIKTRLVDTVTIPTLLQLFQAGRLKPTLVTHRYPFKDIMQAYQIFQRAPKEGVLKIGIDF